MSTILEVAKKAGVSVATVSRVLSNPEIVAEPTRLKVMAAIDALNYVPNAAAKSLRTSRSGRILVTVPDIANPFFSKIIRGVEEAARAEDYAVVLVDTRHDPQEEAKHAMMLHRREADGLIFLGHALPSTVAELVRSKGAEAPVVNGCEFSPELGVSSVHIDNEKAARTMADHLYDLGHREIGIITGPLVSPLSRDRLNGAKLAAAAHNAESGLRVLNGDFSIAAGAAAAQSLLSLSHRPTAIFCFSDEMAIGAIHEAKKAGLRIPHDISIAGFDDIRFCPYTDPPLTTINQPMVEIGRTTVRLLMDILKGNAETLQSITLPHKLIVRDSTASARG